ncbi:MAG: hypothetical protein HC886_18825 [Leptolyngbyaceae cyanobacterium SM1_1_3]|nr:hypothetical protein [Leptolyngbyaceae cyanobacterium SM1_1_3]
MIIPSQEEGDIRVLLHRPFSQIQVCVRSLGEVTLSALDVRGHCIAQGHTQDFAAQHPGQSIPAVWLTVTANQMASLIIGAKAPFVVEALQLRYQ